MENCNISHIFSTITDISGNHDAGGHCHTIVLLHNTNDIIFFETSQLPLHIATAHVEVHLPISEPY